MQLEKTLLKKPTPVLTDYQCLNLSALVKLFKLMPIFDYNC